MNEPTKTFQGTIIRCDETQFEGQDGAILQGKNVELVTGNERGVKFYAPIGRDGYTTLEIGAEVVIQCTMRVRDNGTLKYTMIWCKLLNEQTEQQRF